jgi:hypothetical protein
MFERRVSRKTYRKANVLVWQDLHKSHLLAYGVEDVAAHRPSGPENTWNLKLNTQLETLENKSVDRPDPASRQAHIPSIL